MNTRRYPRSMREAFREWPENCLGVEKPIKPIPCGRSWFWRVWFALFGEAK